MPTEIAVADVVFDSTIYPRQKWSTSTIERYVDALESGDDFPPIIVESDTNRLLDGKHRLEAYKKAERPSIPVEVRSVPSGMSAMYYAATLSAKHGDRLSNADIKLLAEAEFEADPTIDVVEWGQRLGVSKSTVYRYVSHILNRAKAGREENAWRLSKLGWTQKEIGERLGVDRSMVSKDVNNSQLGNIHTDLGEEWNEHGIGDWCNRTGCNITNAWAAMLDGMDDLERLERLGIKTQPYDVWNFSSCHDLMGDSHPGRIPGQLVSHVLFFYTKPGDLVVDPMAGSGTTLDACLLMGRKCRGYDIDHRHERVDIEKNDLSDCWPDTVSKASLVFWDPPYFDKMDKGTIGEDGYIEGSISGKDPDEYREWLATAFFGLRESVKDGCKFAFLMSDWDSENAKQHKGHPGIFIWDYADILRESGWRLTRHIQCPLPTQQVHPDIVNKHRSARRMARLERYLIVSETA